MTRIFLALLFVLVSSSAAIAATQTLYYGGDSKFPGGYANQNNTLSTWRFTYRIYDDFQVTSPQWQINTLYANLGGDAAAGTSITDASYEIRTGMGTGNLGTLVAGGAVPATLAYTGSKDGYNLFRLQVNLSAALTLPAGAYWLSLVPNTSLSSGQLYLRDSLLGNGIGSPLADGMSYSYSQFYFTPTTPPTGPTLESGDFSVGIIGTALAPEPAFASLLFLAVSVGGRRLRRTSTLKL